MGVANQRVEGKKLIGAQASAELWRAVDTWLLQHPAKTVTDFVLAASLEKLAADGIPVDATEVLRDLRGRAARNPALNDSANSPTTLPNQKAVAAALGKNYKLHSDRSNRSRKSASKSPPLPGDVPPPSAH